MHKTNKINEANITVSHDDVKQSILTEETKASRRVSHVRTRRIHIDVACYDTRESKQASNVQTYKRTNVQTYKRTKQNNTRQNKTKQRKHVYAQLTLVLELTRLITSLACRLSRRHHCTNEQPSSFLQIRLH